MQRRRSREEWRQIVQVFQDSGLKAVEFAQSKGLNVNTFSWWRHELRQEARREKLTLVPVRAAPVVQPLVIRFPDGTEMQVPCTAKPEWVGRIADQLR